MKIIKFSTNAELKGVIPDPVPAKKLIPDWFKKLESQHGPVAFKGRQVQRPMTIKACPPVLDYLCTGYIIPLHSDMFAHEESDDFCSLQCNLDIPIVDYHSKEQVKTSHFEDRTSYKLINPWTIETPKGYSCLFMKPFYSDTGSIEVLPAVVDTDVYHNINFPFYINKEIKEGDIWTRGTPIVQVIPFKREEWKMESSTVNNLKKHKENLFMRSVFGGGYKNFLKTKKVFN